MKSKPPGGGGEQTSIARLSESIIDKGNWMNDVRFAKWLRYGLLGVAILVAVMLLWPFYSVPTGSRGVVTQFGRIIGIENEGLAILPPWQKLANFSIRAEQADIENADGSTSDTQPVKVSMTVRYSIMPDKVAEVYEKYSHSGDLSSYVQTATQEIFKAVTAKYVATDLISKRANVSADINAAL
jgi:regulator of protease activity HflC (stomatin/prohibitin superfamily)